MMKRPKILITNDDGIHAPGIKQLWQTLRDFADLFVIAPQTEQSGVSLSITLHHPLRVETHQWEDSPFIWSVSGTPSDCVKLGLNVILPEKPDMVVTGINRGTNAGTNVLYSGTVAGAIEGAIQGIPSIAFSCCEEKTPNYDCVLPLIPTIVQHFFEHPLPISTVLNVNFPEAVHGPIKGVKLARQGKGRIIENPDHRTHPREGKSYYWLGGKTLVEEEDPESDISWLNQGFAAAVPIHIGELTDLHQLRLRKERFEALFDR